MDIESFLNNFADAVEGLDRSAIEASTNFRQLDEWDSLAALTVIAMVNADYGAVINGDDIAACGDLAALHERVASRAG